MDNASQYCSGGGLAIDKLSGDISIFSHGNVSANAQKGLTAIFLRASFQPYRATGVHSDAFLIHAGDRHDLVDCLSTIRAQAANDGYSGALPHLVREAVPSVYLLDFWPCGGGAYFADRSAYLWLTGLIATKAGKLTKVLYDDRRRQLLKEFARRIGPAERLLLGGRTAPEAIRIARAGGVPATANIARNAQHLNRLSKMATHGGILLTGVGLLAGYGVGLFLMSNPVGWGVSLILAVGATATSYGAGKVSRFVYDNYLHSIDFVGATGTDEVCG